MRLFVIDKFNICTLHNRLKFFVEKLTVRSYQLAVRLTCHINQQCTNRPLIYCTENKLIDTTQHCGFGNLVQHDGWRRDGGEEGRGEYATARSHILPLLTTTEAWCRRCRRRSSNDCVSTTPPNIYLRLRRSGNSLCWLKCDDAETSRRTRVSVRGRLQGTFWGRQVKQNGAEWESVRKGYSQSPAVSQKFFIEFMCKMRPCILNCLYTCMHVSLCENKWWWWWWWWF